MNTARRRAWARIGGLRPTDRSSAASRAWGVALLLALTLGGGAAGAEPYRVRRGDTLQAVAARHGCDLKQLRAANGLTHDHLALDQSLLIPPSCLKAGAAGGAGAGDEPRPRVEALPARPAGPGELSAGGTGPYGRPVIGSGRGAGLGGPEGDEAFSLSPRPVVDHLHLSAALRARGFEAGPNFKALVVEVVLDAGGDRIERERVFDFDGTGGHTDWNPASTVKLFAAIGALEYTASRGISPQAEITFNDTSGLTTSHRLDALVELAMVDSDNIAYNRLVQVAGYDFLNRQSIINQLGLQQTALNRPYARHAWVRMTGQPHFRDSPPLTVTRAGRGRRSTRTVQIPARTGMGEYPCERTAACTSLADLAEAMRRVMLYEQLPPGERPRFDKPELRVLRNAMRTPKKRGTDMIEGLRTGYRKGLEIYHKPGFAGSWMSDVAYLKPRGANPRRWIVAIANHPGRTSVVPGARLIGQILAQGDLDRPVAHVPGADHRPH